MLKIQLPNFYQYEHLYILNILFTNYLGLNYEVGFYENNHIKITKVNSSDKPLNITINSFFFSELRNYNKNFNSISNLSLANWTPLDDGIEVDLTKPSIPVLYGSPGVVKKSNHIHLNLDIFGSVFFMLTRYEELVIKERDQHDRFLAHLSHAYKNGYLNRPLVDEYVEILKQCMKMLWPDLKFKKKEFSIHVSHDVDQVSRYQTRSNVYQYLRAIGGDLSRGYIKDLMYSPLSYFHNQENFSTSDPYNTFDWLMDISDDNNLKSTFNFICGKSSKCNADYDIEDNKIKNLIRQIHER